MIEGPIEVGNVLRDASGKTFRVAVADDEWIGAYLIDKDGWVISVGWWISSHCANYSLDRVEMQPYEPTGEIPQLGIS